MTSVKSDLQRPCFEQILDSCNVGLSIGRKWDTVTCAFWSALAHGDLQRWCDAIDTLPELQAENIELNRDAITLRRSNDCDEHQIATLRNTLMELHPWRKGPFDLFGVHIDTEWRSDWKWARIKDQIEPLVGRRVLDVGCGSGYHLWRMMGDGASSAIGVEPHVLFNLQFHAICRLARLAMAGLRIGMVPLALESLPPSDGFFDTIFSLGVLYHRRNPFDHISDLKKRLRRGGQLVLESLVIEGDDNACLLPGDRYARMRNVWFVPSAQMLGTMIRRCGFSEVMLIDQTATTTQEQRMTEWMTFESLEQCLDPNDFCKTVEGYPAPIRATFVANA